MSSGLKMCRLIGTVWVICTTFHCRKTVALHNRLSTRNCSWLFGKDLGFRGDPLQWLVWVHGDCQELAPAEPFVHFERERFRTCPSDVSPIFEAEAKRGATVLSATARSVVLVILAEELHAVLVEDEPALINAKKLQKFHLNSKVPIGE